MKPVARCIFKVVLPFGLLAAVLAMVLFSGYTQPFSSPEWVQFLTREIQAACRDLSTQWMVVVCLVSYFVVFAVLARRFKFQVSSFKSESESKTQRTKPPSSILHPPSAPLQRAISSPDFWLTGFVALVLLRYAVDYPNAAKSLEVVVLLTGIVIGKGIALWAAWNPSLTSNVQRPTSGEYPAPSSILHLLSSSRQFIIIGILTILFAVASLWHPERGMEFFYRGQQRWTGPWDNPNLFGLLMGVGAVLAVGLLVSGFRFQGRSLNPSTFNLQPRAFRGG